MARLLKNRRFVRLDRLFAVDQYPRDVTPFYMQAYSVTRYLIDLGGRQRFFDFLTEVAPDRDLEAMIRRHYGVESFSVLEKSWLSQIGNSALQTN